DCTLLSMAGTFYPTKGTLFDAIGDFFDHPWGSRRRYQTYKLWVRQPPRLPLAWHPCCIYERPRGGDERLPAMFHSAGSANPMRSPSISASDDSSYITGTELFVDGGFAQV